MEKVLILENGQKYNLCPMNSDEFNIWTENRYFNYKFTFDRFKRKNGYVEISDFSPFLLKNSKIELRDGSAKFIFKNYKYELDDQSNKKRCNCDGINGACSDYPKD